MFVTIVYNSQIIQELWRVKDGMAQEHGNDVRKLADYLQVSHPEDLPVTERKPAVDVSKKVPSQRPLKTDEARSLRGTGWEGDLDEMRSTRTT